MLKLPFVPIISLVLIYCFRIAAVSPVLSQQPELKSVYKIVKSGNGQVLGITFDIGPCSGVDLVDSVTGQLIRSVDISPSLPNIIALSPTGDRIAHAGPDGDLGIFDVNTGIDNIITTGGAVQIHEVEWNPANDQVAYTVGSGVYILDTVSRTTIRIIGAGGPRVGDVAWSPDGQRLATSHFAEDPFNPGTVRRTVKIWDLAAPGDPLTVPSSTIENRGGGRLSWHPDGSRLALLESFGFFIFDIAANQIVADIPLAEEFPYTLAWNNTGSLLATGGNSLRIWDTTTWQVTQTITLPEAVSSFQWSLDGQHVFNDGGLYGLYRDDVPVMELDKVEQERSSQTR